MTTTKEFIDAESGIATHQRTGFLMDACVDDAKLHQGLWQPMDTLPVIARLWAKKHPKLATAFIQIYIALWGKKEVT